MSGTFITLEGSEGVGKSTQLTRLGAELRLRGKTVVNTREPGGTAGAEDIRALLMTGDDSRWNARTEALLFAAARADHVAKLIRPALARGDWVLCDRFVDSSRAYQGGGGGLDDDDIMALHRVGSGGLLPDRTLLLEYPVAQGAARASARTHAEPDRMGAKPVDYHAEVVARLHALANAEPGRFRVVDASGGEGEVTSRLLAAVEDLL